MPVVNESPEARPGLSNPHVVWAEATPAGLAAALSDVVEHPAPDVRAGELAQSVVDGGWEEAKRAVVGAVERRAYGSSTAG